MFRRSRLRVVGVSLLAFAVTGAVSAPTVQADWTITQGESSTLHLVVSGFFRLGVIRTTTQRIHCKSNFFGEALVQLSKDHKTSATSVSWIASCTDEFFSGVCTVSSPEASPEEVIFEADGTMESKGGSVYATLEDPEIAYIEYSGIDCPLAEIDGTLGGSMTFTLLNAGAEMSTHGVEIDEKELFLGEEEAFLDGEGEGESGAFEGEVEAEGGSPFAISFK